MTLDRIAVVGISASGKSTFARRLAERTGLPLLHGDVLEWMPDWAQRPPAALQAMHAQWLARPRWIIEGWIDLERVCRLNAADLVIDLDYSRWRCAWRVLPRMLRRQRRAEMPPGCVDRFEAHYLNTVLFKQERPYIDGALAAARMKDYRRFTTPREAEAWLSALR